MGLLALTPFGNLTAPARDKYLDDAGAIVLRPEESLIAPAPRTTDAWC